MTSPYIRLYAASMTMLVATLLADPVHAATCDGFVDVSASASYCPAVTYVKDRGVTVGCTDATHYCPNDNVTRAQMALYLQRMGLADSTNSLGDHTNAIGGGTSNTSSGGGAVVGGGTLNSATTGSATVAGGYHNTAGGDGGYSTVGGGTANSSTGFASTVPGGDGNSASGNFSFAAGVGAVADQTECVVFSLWTPGSPAMSCLGTPNVFRVGSDHGFSVDYSTQRSDGGGTHWVEIGDTIGGQTIGTWNGAYLSDGGTWTNASDRNAKEDFAEIDSNEILARVATMPITRWKYKRDPGVTHLGPVAQDFHAAFGLGLNDVSISTVDEEGVALAAIQGLNAKVEARDRVIANQDRQLVHIMAELDMVRRTLAEIRIGLSNTTISAP